MHKVISTRFPTRCSNTDETNERTKREIVPGGKVKKEKENGEKLCWTRVGGSILHIHSQALKGYMRISSETAHASWSFENSMAVELFEPVVGPIFQPLIPLNRERTLDEPFPASVGHWKSRFHPVSTASEFYFKFLYTVSFGDGLLEGNRTRGI